MAFTTSPRALVPWPAANKPADIAAVKAIAQAAINVELFTIPLYMAAMYSVQGMHQITSVGNDFYQGRQWPGLGPAAPVGGQALSPNQQAFNVVFSVFIEEMLHLQLASNVATALGVTPTYESPLLQDADHGWTCYGPTLSVIPHIIDLTDTTDYTNVAVNIGALTKEQLQLFLAIEQPDNIARAGIQPSKIGKYFPSVPFANWTASSTEADLPMFGTIGWMYQCYWDYLNFAYDDGTTLIGTMFAAGSVQNDMFNVTGSGHPDAEYPLAQTTLAGITIPADALNQINTMLSAITDQGEGSTLPNPPQGLLGAVQPEYRASKPALEADYPGATDSGDPAPSPDAAARADNDSPDHFERFTEILAGIDQVQTWIDWFGEGNSWSAADLQASDYNPDSNPYNLPATADVAQALNNLASVNDAAVRQANFTMLSQAAVGALAGITSVLYTYWSVPGTNFPYPAMSGSGDRMSIIWAIFGQAPDLSVGIGTPDDSLHHSCQALDFSGTGTNDCAGVELFHACRGSNNCKAQGGCGFVQLTSGGGLCGHFMADAAKAPMLGASTVYSAPSDNKCGTFGGCAVPISASQLLNKSGNMQLFNFSGSENTPIPLQPPLAFTTGQLVHDVAYQAYRQVMAQRGVTVPETPPAPNDLRLAFIPST